MNTHKYRPYILVSATTIHTTALSVLTHLGLYASVNHAITDAWSAPSRYLTNVGNLLDGPFGKKLQWNFDRISYIFSQ